MKHTVLRYGIYGAITICVLFLTALYAGKNLSFTTQEIIGYATMAISLLFVFFGIKHYRDHENDGVVSFGRALAIGILISLFAAVAFGLIDVVYVTYMNPDFTTEYYATLAEQMKNSLPESEYKLKLVELEAQKKLFSNPLMSFLLMSSTVLILGFIISLISGVILQRKPTTTT